MSQDNFQLQGTNCKCYFESYLLRLLQFRSWIQSDLGDIVDYDDHVAKAETHPHYHPQTP